jgi:hypothetical protein
MKFPLPSKYIRVIAVSQAILKKNGVCTSLLSGRSSGPQVDVNSLNRESARASKMLAEA